MSNSSIYSGSEPEDSPDLDQDLVARGEAGEPPAGDPAISSALPVVVEVEYNDQADDDETGPRQTLDLDAGGAASGGRFDLSALIDQFDAAPRRRAARPASEGAPTPPSQDAVESSPIYDLSSPSADPIASSSAADAAEVKRLRDEVVAERNRFLRANADLANYRRKAEQDRERAVRDSAERLIKQILPIVDDFERGQSGTSATRSYDQLADGVAAILRNFETLLTKYGVESVQSVGQLFDPDIHEAVAVDSASDQPEDTVVEELRKGYTLDGRLLRAAMVKVARHTAEPVQSDAVTLDETESAAIEISGDEPLPAEDQA